MARLAPDRGASPEVQLLSARIINTQMDEIATMQQWLRDRGQPVPEPVSPPMDAAHGPGHPDHMPGMVTAEQMRALVGPLSKAEEAGARVRLVYTL